MPRHFRSAIPSQGFVEPLGKLSCLLDQGRGHTLCVFVRGFGQHYKTGMTLNQRRDVAIVGSGNQFALPPLGHTVYALSAMMTRNGTIFDLSWALTNGDSILDLA